MNQPQTAIDFADLLDSARFSHQVSTAAMREVAKELRRLAELERDAARYRWLRDNSTEYSLTQKDGYGGRELKGWSDLDAAIDAAMGEAK